MSSEPNVPDSLVATRTKEATEPRVRRIPPYHVILENDDFHSMEFVVEVLLKVLGCSVEKAIELTLEAHRTGW